MQPLTRILKDYQESGAMSALVTVHAAIDNETLLTKGGDLLKVVKISGPDSECMDASEIDALARGFESALRVLDGPCRLYQYFLKRQGAAIPVGRYASPVVAEAVRSRCAYLEERSRRLFTTETYFVISYEGWKHSTQLTGRLSQILRNPALGLRGLLSPQRAISGLEQGLDEARELLARRASSFVHQLPESLCPRVLDKMKAFRFIRELLNYTPYKAEAVSLKYDDHLDFQACDSALECHRDHLVLDDYHVQVLTLKEPPAQTFANLQRTLQEVACNLVLVSEWKGQDAAKVRGEIQSMRRHFHNSTSSLMNYVTSSSEGVKDRLIDDSAVGHVADLGACLTELELHGRTFGEFSLTVVLYSQDPAAVRRAAAETYKAFAAGDGQLIEERANLLNAWLAALPGNHAYNLRRLYLSDRNAADLSFLHGFHTGEKRNAHLDAEYLAVLETDQHAPFFLNLHHQDVAHTAVFGATGSGKSFFLNFLLTHLQKYDPITCIFDLGGSYESLTRLFEGAYLRVGIGKSAFTINPFALPPTPENLHFLLSLVKVLLESDTFRVTAQDERDLYQQIENLYAIDADQRRLLTLANMLGRHLRIHLHKWVEGGPYAAVFDNVQDNLTFARFQAFDFEGMEKAPQILEPLLFYILHRTNASIQDSGQAAVLKAFVIDEAWRFFRHSAIRLYIVEGLKTWRKKNAAVILATQSSDDLLRSEMLPVVVESCPTKIFLANPDADTRAYREIFHLNQTEAALLSQLAPKRQILLKRPDYSKVLSLEVSARDYWLYTSSPADRRRRQAAFDQYGFQQGLEILAKEHSR